MWLSGYTISHLFSNFAVQKIIFHLTHKIK